MEPGRDVVEQAALWHARLGDECSDDGQRDADERRAFEAWRRKDPLHALAFERIATLDARLRNTGRAERVALKTLSSTRKRVVPIVLVLCTAMAAAWQVRHLPAVATRLADYRTPPGVQRNVTLADGSRLTLDTNTALNAHIDGRARTLELLQGAVLVDVKKNADAAFVIHTRHGSARALGTAYSVRQNALDTVVTVIRSTVEVCTSQRSRCETLSAGQRARLDAKGMTTLPDIDTGQAAAWSRGWLAANDMPLVQVLHELNRYRESPILFDARRLAGMNVSGHYPLQDTDRTLQALARSLPIAIDTSDAMQPKVYPR